MTLRRLGGLVVHIVAVGLAGGNATAYLGTAAACVVLTAVLTFDYPGATPIEGGRPRLIAILSFMDRPDVMFTPEDRVQFYGRAG